MTAPELDWRQGFGFGRRVHAVVGRGATHGPARCGRVVSIGGKAWSATPAEVRCATCAELVGPERPALDVDPSAPPVRQRPMPAPAGRPVPDAGAAPGEADTTSTREDPTP